MSNFRQHLVSLRSLRSSKRRAAFFDLDRTLIAVYSALPLLLEQIRARQVSPLGAMQQVLMALGQRNEIYEFEEVLETAIGMLRGVNEQEFSRLGDKLFHKHLQKKIYSEAQELVDTHRQLGHQLVIV
jgi:phosphoserine phosphatase